MYNIQWEEKLRCRLAELGWSVAKFAVEMGKVRGSRVGRSRASGIIKTRNPHAKTIRLVSETLGIPFSELFLAERAKLNATQGGKGP